MRSANDKRRSPRKPSTLKASLLTAISSADSTAQRLGKRTEYRIYPSIGVARLGDSQDGYVLGPEAPGIAPNGPFRGQSDKGLLPQAVRFRIYRVDVDSNENETVIEEIVLSSTISIEWTVTLANQKAAGNQIFNRDGGTLGRTSNPTPRNPGLDRNKLTITGTGTIAGKSTVGPSLTGSIEFASPNKKGPRVDNIKLAALRTDEAGRLVVVGGPGVSGSPTKASLLSFSDNNGWYDSVSDGPVTAKLTLDGKVVQVVPSWALVTVPRYAPEVYGIVTWYDRAVAMARTDADGTFNAPRTTSFTQDVYPILKRADGLSAVHDGTHSTVAAALSDATRIASFAATAARSEVAARLTPINTDATGPEIVPKTSMPRLNSGANPDLSGPTWTFLSLTKYQMAHIQNWANGNFAADWPGSETPPPTFDKIPVSRQAWALTEAALEACVGGSFFPGIEGTYIIAQMDTYHPSSNLRQEFRINPSHPAGYLTERMALPWQADFADCADFWWPSQRPVSVTTSSGARDKWDRGVGVSSTQARHLNMVSNWMRLGLVVKDSASGRFVEVDRTLELLVS
jgi:L-Lysine epsilon oxidase N-terminal/L-lysine epsilon oxidase C-terminal domain